MKGKRMLRRLPPRLRTWIAKFQYGTGGFIWAHVKWPQPLVTLDGQRVRRRWLGPAWALEFALRAEYIDPEHFSHWAYQHKCSTWCPHCKGHNCGNSCFKD